MSTFVSGMLAAGFMLLVAACSSGDGTELRDAPIQSADVVSVDTFPPQYEVHLVALIPGSSCHRPQAPSVDRDGTTFRITVQNLFTGDDFCTADLGSRSLVVALPGEFESGTEYAVLINREPHLAFVAE